MKWQNVVYVIVVAILARAFIHFIWKSANTAIVQTESGPVHGVCETSLRHKEKFHAFRGIPYAKAPVGDLRFKAPEPVDSWHPNVLAASEYGSNCIQPDELYPDAHPQSEDCLYLNVFVPEAKRPDEKLPVMFFIHGGGYGEGSGNDFIYGPDFLIENRVILVTINYRLGVLGFLSLGLPEYSGNMGLKDQQMALKWTHENIGHFGGDNTLITIFGQSAGAASTHLHVLSTESQKYFERAIVMSGSALNLWALSQSNDHTALAFELAESWNKPQENVANLVELLKTVPANRFIDPSRVLPMIRLTMQIEFGPVVEDFDAVRPYMLVAPEEAINGSTFDKDVMFGFTSQECLALYQEDSEDDFELVLPFRGVDLPADSQEYRRLSQEVHNLYFGARPADASARTSFINLMSDMNFAYHSAKSAKVHAQRSSAKTFLYHFDVDSKLNLYKASAQVDLPGANHCDDLCYLFRCGFGAKHYDDVFGDRNDKQSRISRQALDNFTRLLTNFAKFGRPIYDNDIADNDLPAIDGDRGYFVDISNVGIAIGENPHKTTVDFWTYLERKAFNGKCL